MDVMTFDNLPEIEKVEVLIEKIPIWVWFVLLGGLIIGIIICNNAVKNKRKATQLADDKAYLEREKQALSKRVQLYEAYYKTSIKS
jgi:uncharacterized membrane-anchored protein YhcB (DUF1043 family)